MSRMFPAERGDIRMSAFDEKCMSKKCIKRKMSDIYTMETTERDKISRECLKDDFQKYAMKKPYNEKKYLAGLKKWEQCFDKVAIKSPYNKYYLDMLECGKKHKCYSKSYINKGNKRNMIENNNKTKKTNNKTNKNTNNIV